MTYLTISEVRTQWVEFMCTFAGRGKMRYYEDLFDAMLAQHDEQVAAVALGRAKTALDLENLASVQFIASDGIPSVGINTNEDAKNKVLKGLDDLMKQYLRRRA